MVGVFTYYVSFLLFLLIFAHLFYHAVTKDAYAKSKLQLIEK